MFDSQTNCFASHFDAAAYLSNEIYIFENRQYTSFKYNKRPHGWQPINKLNFNIDNVPTAAFGNKDDLYLIGVIIDLKLRL